MKYEVEVKSLLGSAEKAEELKMELKEIGADFLDSNSQLNHYFKIVGNDEKEVLAKLGENIKKYLPSKKYDEFLSVIESGEGFSVRTRKKDDEVIFIIKFSVGDDGDSTNGISRQEFEVNVDLSIDQLDKILLDSGLEYQSKWSRTRQKYGYDDFVITIDKNAGYGYVAEVELMVGEKEEIAGAKKRIYELMEELGLEELGGDKLDEMFEYYSNHWQEYYGTDKTFSL